METADTKTQTHTAEAEKAMTEAIHLINKFPLVPDHQKTEQMCISAVSLDPYLIKYVPQQYLTKKLCSLALMNTCVGATSLDMETNLELAFVCAYLPSLLGLRIDFTVLETEAVDREIPVEELGINDFLTYVQPQIDDWFNHMSIFATSVV